MSQIQVFAFVEGFSDRFVYGKLCSAVFAPAGISFEIRTGNELPGATGGKAACLAFHDYLRRARSLVDNFGGKLTVVVFFLDKDVDDFTRTQRRSSHIIYTKYYEIENHYFIEGDPHEAGAAAAGLTVQLVRSGIPAKQAWLDAATAQWKEWVRLCVTARLTRANCSISYRRSSQVNQNIHDSFDSHLYASAVATLFSASGLSRTDFDRILARVSRFVDRQYASGRADMVFKGKWYTTFLAKDLRRIGTANPPFRSNGLEEMIPPLLAMQLDPTQPWADHFVEKLLPFVALLSA